jgi:hypothetical protein
LDFSTLITPMVIVKVRSVNFVSSSKRVDWASVSVTDKTLPTKICSASSFNSVGLSGAIAAVAWVGAATRESSRPLSKTGGISLNIEFLSNERDRSTTVVVVGCESLGQTCWKGFLQSGLQT